MAIEQALNRDLTVVERVFKGCSRRVQRAFNEGEVEGVEKVEEVRGMSFGFLVSGFG